MCIPLKVAFAGALKAVLSMPVAVTCKPYMQTVTMLTVHARTHTYVAYSITVFLQNQENGPEIFAVTEKLSADPDSYL